MSTMEAAGTGPGAATAPGSPERLLARVRREWRGATLSRASILAVAAAAGVATLLVLLDLALDLPPVARRVLGLAPVAAALPPLVAGAWRALRTPTRPRLALLAEERLPELQNVLATAISTRPEGTVGRLFSTRLDSAIGAALERAASPRLVPWDLRRPGIAALATVGALVLLAALAGGPRALLESWSRPPHEAPLATAPGSALGRATGGRDGGVRVGALRWTATPPSYTGRTATDPSGEEPVRALAGSRVAVRFAVTGPGAEWRVRPIGAGGLAAERVLPEDGAVEATFTLSPEVRGIELEGRQDGEVVARRVVPVVAVPDSPPAVILETPARDEVLAAAEGLLTVRARGEDDHGVAALRLGWIRSRGGGESFAFEEGEAAFERLVEDGGLVGETRLDLAGMGLEPGDVLHLRAIAGDRNDVTGPGVGVSATRVIRIASAGEEHQVTLLIGAPPDVEERPVLSQRMIILMTEGLRDEAEGMTSAEVSAEAIRIAREQARLRARVGEILFARSTGGIDTPEELASDPFSGDFAPHGHADHEHVDGDEDWDAADPESVLEAASRATGQGTLEELSHVHDEAPVVAVNRELMGAYNAMWEAERALRQAAADSALPPEYRALEILQSVREGERVFARGEVTVPPVDVAAARGTGELTDLAVAPRTGGRVAEASALTALEEAIQALRQPPSRAALDIADVAARLLTADAVDAATAALLSRAADAAARGAPAEAAARLAEARARLEPAVEAGAGVALERARDDLGSAYLRQLAASATDAVTDGGEAATRTSAAPGAPFVFATARYASGDWDSAQLVGANLMHSLAQYTGIDVATEAEVVDLSSEEVFEFPFLFLTGHLPVRFTEAESRNLRRFVERGGFLFIDDHNHDIDAAFHRTATAELRRLFGPDALQPLPADHEIYTAFFEFDDGPPTTTHELNGWGDGLIHEELHAITVDGRVGVLYSNKDYASEWNYHAVNKRFQALDNTRIGVNILVYALTR